MADKPKKPDTSSPKKETKGSEQGKDPQKQAADPDGTGVPVGEDQPANEPVE
jgi:hypothetical protein